MRRLTFRGFLDSYLRALSGSPTLAAKRLAAMSELEPRLVEPMLLWATVRGRAPMLTVFLGDHPDRQAELDLLVRLHQRGSLETALAREDSRLRPEYAKVWRSYVVRRDATQRDAELKLEAREHVLALESAKRVTRYRMAKDLGLNPGNLHAYLAQGNPAKLSLERVAELVRYLEAA